MSRLDKPVSVQGLEKLLSEFPWLWAVGQVWRPGKDIIRVHAATEEWLKEKPEPHHTNADDNRVSYWASLGDWVSMAKAIREVEGSDRLNSTTRADMFLKHLGFNVILEAVVRCEFITQPDGRKMVDIYQPRKGTLLSSLCKKAVQ